MTMSKAKRLCGILAGLSLTAAAVCLGAGCFYLYRSGGFNRAAVAAAFRPIAWVVFLALGLSLLSGVLSLLFPQASAPKPLPGMRPTPVKKAGSWVRYGLLGAAVALVAFGCFTGGTMDVLTKAVNICTECIGLG